MHGGKFDADRRLERARERERESERERERESKRVRELLCAGLVSREH